MKTMNDFKKLEFIYKNKEYKKKINQVTNCRPLGAILTDYSKTIKKKN